MPKGQQQEGATQSEEPSPWWGEEAAPLPRGRAEDARAGLPGCGSARLPWQGSVFHTCSTALLPCPWCPGRSVGFLERFANCTQKTFARQLPFRGKQPCEAPGELGEVGTGEVEQHQCTPSASRLLKTITKCQDALYKLWLSVGATGCSRKGVGAACRTPSCITSIRGSLISCLCPGVLGNTASFTRTPPPHPFQACTSPGLTFSRSCCSL